MSQNQEAIKRKFIEVKKKTQQDKIKSGIMRHCNSRKEKMQFQDKNSHYRCKNKKHSPDSKK